jgi:MFS family permease
MRHPDLRLLRNSQFRQLFLARSISVLGSAIGNFALAFAILALPTGSPTLVGIVLGTMSVVRIAATLAGGLLGDRYPRSVVLATGEGLSGLGSLGLGLAFLAGRDEVLLLAPLAALLGLGLGVFFPALTGMVADVVPTDDLKSANALLRLTTNAAKVGGIGIAGALVALAGGAAAMLLDAASFFISMALIFSTRTPAMAPSGNSALADLRGGWRAFTERRWVVAIVASAFGVNAFWGAIMGVYGPVVANAELGGAGVWAGIQVAGTIGSIAGTVVALRIRAKHPLFVGMLLFGTFALVPLSLGLRLPVLLIAAVFFLVDVGLDILSIAWDTALQQHVPRESLSRVSAYDWLGSMVATPVGLALAGPALLVWDVHAILLASSVLIAIMALAPLLVREVRTLGAGTGTVCAELPEAAGREGVIGLASVEP